MRKIIVCIRQLVSNRMSNIFPLSTKNVFNAKYITVISSSSGLIRVRVYTINYCGANETPKGGNETSFAFVEYSIVVNSYRLHDGTIPTFQKTPKAVVTANTRKSVPPMIPITFSDKYLAKTAPPETAMPVATACAAMAPAATLTGFWAADSAMVDKNDRSPNSAAKTNPKILTIRALYGV